jgi:hypothetical protein
MQIHVNFTEDLGLLHCLTLRLLVHRPYAEEDLRGALTSGSAGMKRRIYAHDPNLQQLPSSRFTVELADPGSDRS